MDSQFLIHARGTWGHSYSQVILEGTLTGVQGNIRCKVLAALSTVKYLLVT